MRGPILSDKLKWMPVLGEQIYEKDEIRGYYTAADVAADLQLEEKLIISLGCTTGQQEMCKVLGRHNLYIAPADYVRGDSALFFAVNLFYELSKNTEDKSKIDHLKQAFALAKAVDEETRLFTLYPA